MKLENQVTNLELSQKLKELGVKQEYQKGDWCYENVEGGRLLLVINVEEEYLSVVFPFAKPPNDQDPVKMRHSLVKAWTVAELGEMFSEVKIGSMSENFYMQIGYEMFWKKYENGTKVIDKHSELDKSEANARAKMLIYLLENKLIKI
jgi:hypothetical protein